jgi:hypothetical protein
VPVAAEKSGAVADVILVKAGARRPRNIRAKLAA